MRLVLLAAVVVILSGCESQTAPPLRERIAMRRQTAQTWADQTPSQRVYRFDLGELVVVDINTLTAGYADSQKCFLWRDREFRTASLQCPSGMEAAGPVALPDKEPETPSRY